MIPDHVLNAFRFVAIADSSDLPQLRAALTEADSRALGRIMTPTPQTSSSADPLLTYAKAAEHISMSESYIETLVRQKKLRAVTLPATDKGNSERPGRSRRIPLSALKALGRE